MQNVQPSLNYILHSFNVCVLFYFQGTSCTIETATGDAPFRITLPLNDGITIFDNVDKQIFNEKSTGKISEYIFLIIYVQPAQKKKKKTFNRNT